MEVVEVATGGRKRLLRKSKPKKRKRTRKPKPSVLKRKLDTVFSLYIRAKYSKKCYTCKASGKVLQCGHFISRSYLATRWEEDNCRPQCVGCNIWGKGKPLDFEENLIEELGIERVMEMKAQRKMLLKLKPEWYLERISFYERKLADLT